MTYVTVNCQTFDALLYKNPEETSSLWETVLWKRNSIQEFLCRSSITSHKDINIYATKQVAIIPFKFLLTIPSWPCLLSHLVARKRHWKHEGLSFRDNSYDGLMNVDGSISPCCFLSIRHQFARTKWSNSSHEVDGTRTCCTMIVSLTVSSQSTYEDQGITYKAWVLEFLAFGLEISIWYIWFLFYAANKN